MLPPNESLADSKGTFGFSDSLHDAELPYSMNASLGEHFAGRIDRAPLSLLCKRPNGGLALSVGENYREQRHTAMKILKEFSTGDKLMETYILECVGDLVEHLRSVQDKKEVDMAFPIQVSWPNGVYLQAVHHGIRRICLKMLT